VFFYSLGKELKKMGEKRFKINLAYCMTRYTCRVCKYEKLCSAMTEKEKPKKKKQDKK
jgi:hypothetical protein